MDDAGAIRTEYTYGPFGHTVTSGESSTNPSQFTGRDNDGTGLYYYRARYYSPALQRFVSEDPIGFAGGDFNLYAYVGNSPTNFTDPSGLILDLPLDIALGCGAGAFAGYWDVGAEYLGGRKDVTWGEILERTLAGAAAGCAATLLDPLTYISPFPGAGLADDGIDIGRRAGKGLDNCLNSFAADTPVLMADGSQKPIGEVEVGDQVLAWDERSQAAGDYQVTALIAHDDPGVLELTLGGERLTTTVAHPFYTKERGWVEAGQLRVGERVLTAAGRWGAVQGLRLVARPQRMHNLTVEEVHTYFVGGERWLVHNEGECRKYAPTRKHAPGGWGTPMDLDDATAASVLNQGIAGPNGRQVYGYYNGKVYEFQPDNTGGYHGYPIPGNEAPPAVLKAWRDNGTITNAEYNRHRKGK